MTFYLLKIAVSVVILVAVSEIAKRSSFLGGLFASLPLVSLLAITWLFVETKNRETVAALSTSIFWLVLPSLIFFVAFPLLLKTQLNFYVSMALSIALMLCCYCVMLLVLRKAGVQL